MLLLYHFVLLLIVQFTEGEYENCSTDRSVLLKALFKTPGNLYELDMVFSPARHQSSRFIEVTYTFLDTESIIEGGCNVTYYWALGGFLLVQDPKVFRYTSLLFSRPANTLDYLYLKLPFECYTLVSHGDNTCDCETKENTTIEKLDRLTQQLNQYSKYNDPNSVVQDITSSAQAVCKKELEDKFHKPAKFTTYLGLMLVMPIIVIAILVTVIRSIHPQLHSKLTKSSADHPNLAGFTLTGIYVLIYVLVLDCLAVYYAHTATSSDSLVVVFVTLALDGFVLFVFLILFMSYLIHTQFKFTLPQCTIEHCSCCSDVRECLVPLCMYIERFLLVPLCILPYFYCIFGSKSQSSKLHNGQKVTLTLNTPQEAKLFSECDQEITLITDVEVILKAPRIAKDESGNDIILKAGKKIKLKKGQQVTVRAADQKITFREYQFMLNYGQKASIHDDEVQLKANRMAINLTEDKEFKLHDNQEVMLLNIELPKKTQQATLNPEQTITLQTGNVKLEELHEATIEHEGVVKDVILNAGEVKLESNMEALISSCQEVILTTNMKDNIQENIKVKLNASQDDNINQRTIWIVTGLMIAPLFTIASHSGYILAAWITEPEKTTAAFLVALGSVLYMFFMFRQCYTVYKANPTGLCLTCNLCSRKESDYDEIDGESENEHCCTYKNGWIYCCLPCIPIWVMLSHIVNLVGMYGQFYSCQCVQKCCTKCQNCCSCCSIQDIDYSEPDNKQFSIKWFLLSCSWGWLIVGFLVFVVAAFIYLPLPTFPLAEYLETTIQILIVVLAFMVTYRIFTADDSQIQKFARYLSALKSKDLNTVDSEA